MAHRNDPVKAAKEQPVQDVSHCEVNNGPAPSCFDHCHKPGRQNAGLLGGVVTWDVELSILKYHTFVGSLVFLRVVLDVF